MKIHKTFKYNTLVTLWIAMIILVLTSFLSVIISNYAFKAIREEIHRSMDTTAKHMADKMDEFMWSRTGELTTIASLQAMKSLENPSEIESLLDELKRQFPSFSWIGVLDMDGNVVSATDGILKGENISQRPVYQNGIKGLFIGDVHDAVLLAKLLPNPSGEPMKFVDVSFPLTDRSGETIGVLAAHFSWEWAKEVQKTVLEPLQNAEDIEMFVVSALDQTVLLGPSDRIGTPFVLNRPGYIEASTVADGYMNYPGLNWHIFVRQTEETAYKPIGELQVLIWGFSIGLAALLIFLSLMLSRRISSPLVNLSSAIEKHQDGELITLPKVKGIYEIEHLTHTLYNLFETLHLNNKTIGSLETAASTDSLTTLSNRNGLKIYWQKTTLHHHSLYVLCMDLDGFKEINDTYGHAAGDHVLQIVAARLKAAIREHELVARLGGDEFAIILYANAYQSDALTSMIDYKVATRIITEVSKPIIYEAFSLHVGCSIGGTLWSHPDSLTDALAVSDEALYQAKANGKNQYVFTEMQQRSTHD